MDRERRALLDHAALCRRVASEIFSHTRAAERLMAMAHEYETRALKLLGVSQELFASEQTHSDRVPSAP